MDLASLQQKYFRFWNVEDLSGENMFDKYQKTYYAEKRFDVDVRDGQLNIDFEGENWACSVSAIVVFPLERAAEGERFLQYAEQKRRFHFDNYFKRILHAPTGEALRPTAEDQRRGYVGFVRDTMQDVYDNDLPEADEIGRPLQAEAFAGEYEPMALALVPLQDLGEVTVTAGDLSGPAGTIPAAAIDVGYVSCRISRVTMQGSVYTIQPRWIIPRRVRGDAAERDAAILADRPNASRGPCRGVSRDAFDPPPARPAVRLADRISRVATARWMRWTCRWVPLAIASTCRGRETIRSGRAGTTTWR